MTTRRRMGYPVPMLISPLLTLALCSPSAAQTVTPAVGGNCFQRMDDNLLTAWASTTISAVVPDSNIAAWVLFSEMYVDRCTKGALNQNGCFDIDYLTTGTDKKAQGTGVTAGMMYGTFPFVGRHYFEGGAPFHMSNFNITCPPPPDPSAGCTKPFYCSPIIVPLEKGNQVKLSAVENGVPFDIDGDGVLETVAWPTEPSIVAFLAMDRDGDGRITSGKELFGNVTTDGAPNGFAALMAVEREAPNSWLVAGRDRGFDDLLLWFDRNRDGVSQESELEPAATHLAEISMFFFKVGKRDQYGNQFSYQGWMKLRSKPEEKRPVYDIFLLAR